MNAGRGADASADDVVLEQQVDVPRSPTGFGLRSQVIRFVAERRKGCVTDSEGFPRPDVSRSPANGPHQQNHTQEHRGPPAAVIVGGHLCRFIC